MVAQQQGDDERFGYGFDDYVDDPDVEAVDADIRNADWPKQTNDKIDPLDRTPTPFISNGKWYAWFDLDLMDWDADSPDAPTGMIREEFHKEVMDAYIEADKTRWELYADVVSFLAKWGIKARVVS